MPGAEPATCLCLVSPESQRLRFPDNQPFPVGVLKGRAASQRFPGMFQGQMGLPDGPVRGYSHQPAKVMYIPRAVDQWPVVT